MRHRRCYSHKQAEPDEHEKMKIRHADGKAGQVHRAELSRHHRIGEGHSGNG
jgi:hypothetical protein